MEKVDLPDLSEDTYVESLKISNKISEKAIREVIKNMGLFDGAKILDVPCGIGSQSLLMLEHNQSLNISAIDIGEKQLAYAKNRITSKMPNANCQFIKKDINNLNFQDNSFDFVWCCDGLWPGPKEMGCLAEEPYDILRDFIRITKPGGKIIILFWTSQMLLPGYPLIETALKSTRFANIPVTENSNPDLHILRTPAWLREVGLKDICAQTHAADIYLLNNDNKVGLKLLLEMFFSGAEKETKPEIWQKYQELSNPESKNSIYHQNDYAGFITYTAYSGIVKK